MTGAAQWETIIWIVGFLAGGITAAFAVWFFIDKSIKSAVNGLREDLGVRVSAAAAQISLIERGIADFKAEVAGSYLRKDDGALSQIADGVKEIRADMRTMNARIDGLADRK